LIRYNEQVDNLEYDINHSLNWYTVQPRYNEPFGTGKIDSLQRIIRYSEVYNDEIENADYGI
jgi:hypothetical protein